jgi:hypothetical protein
MGPRWGSTPRRTDRLIVGRVVTLLFAVPCFRKDPTKAAIYWVSQPELQKDEAAKKN